MAYTAENWPIAANMLPFGNKAADGTPNTEAPAESWRDQLQQVVDLDFEFVDPTDAWLSIGELSDERFSEFVDVLDEVGLKIPSISTTRSSVVDKTPYAGGGTMGEQYLARAHKIIDRAPTLGANMVNIGYMQGLTPAQAKAQWFWLEDGHHDDLNDKATRDLAIARTRELADHAKEKGVGLSLEMYEDTYIGTPDLAVEFLHDLNHDNIGLNPDLGNIVRLHREIEDINTMFDKVLPYTNFWHIKNYTRDFDPSTGAYATHPAPLVSGTVNYRQQIRKALDHGFNGVFVVEHYGSDSLGVGALNRDYIKQVLSSYLRHKKS